MRLPKLSSEQQELALYLVKGYKRRKLEYQQAVSSITSLSRSSQASLDLPRGSTPADPTALKAAKLESLDHQENARAVRAVEKAREAIGSDIADADLRRKLRTAVWYSLTEPAAATYAAWVLEGISRHSFRRRKIGFLREVYREFSVE